MNQKKTVMSPDVMKNATFLSRRRVEGWIQLGQDVARDINRKERVEAQLCRACFYASRIGGAAMTTKPCMSCGKDEMYSSTSTDQLCLDCAKAHVLCKRCGGDIDCDVNRGKWPEPKGAGQ